jgi:ComF family protein
MNAMRRLSGRIGQVVAHGCSACAAALDDLVFPWACLVCGAEARGWKGPFCPDCRAGLLADAGRTPRCPRCALPVGPHADLRGGCSQCRGHSFGFNRALALGPYEGAVRGLCLRLKHERDAWLAPWLSSLLAEARSEGLRELPPDAWIVPVPLHWRRRLLRGYNQAEALAHGLADGLRLEVHRPLRRIHSTDRLAGLGASERIREMRGAFAARPDPALRGRAVLLVDDILTTGATSSAAARALRQAGARRVILAVVARTP